MENIISYKAEKSSHKPLLRELRGIHRGSYSLPSISPSHFLEASFFISFFLFSGRLLFLPPLGKKDSNSTGPNPLAKNRADIEVRAVPAKAATEASSSAGWAKEELPQQIPSESDFSVALTTTFSCSASILRHSAPIKV